MEKVVLDVALTHQLEQYEMAKLETLEMTMAQKREEAEISSGGRTE
jgi:hypothetical protein